MTFEQRLKCILVPFVEKEILTLEEAQLVVAVACDEVIVWPLAIIELGERMLGTPSLEDLVDSSGREALDEGLGLGRPSVGGDEAEKALDA